MKNSIQTWRQGQFVDQPQYKNYSEDWKEGRRKEERHNVRSGLTENAICFCPEEHDAKWIAERLNLASKLEQMSYDYATGKTDGKEIVRFVKSSVQ